MRFLFSLSIFCMSFFAQAMEFGEFIGADQNAAFKKIVFECKDGRLTIADADQKTHELFKNKSKVIKSYTEDCQSGLSDQFVFDEDVQTYHLPTFSKHNLYPIWLLLNSYPKRTKIAGKKKKQLKKEALQNYEDFESTLSIDQEIDLLNVAEQLDMPIVEKMISYYLAKKIEKNASHEIPLEKLNRYSMERLAKKFIEKAMPSLGCPVHTFDPKCEDASDYLIDQKKLYLTDAQETYWTIHDFDKKKQVYLKVQKAQDCFKKFDGEFIASFRQNTGFINTRKVEISKYDSPKILYTCSHRSASFYFDNSSFRHTFFPHHFAVSFHPQKKKLMMLVNFHDETIDFHDLKKKKLIQSIDGIHPVWHPKEKMVAYAQANRIYIKKLISTHSLIGKKNYELYQFISLGHDSAHMIKEITWNPMDPDCLAAYDGFSQVIIWNTENNRKGEFRSPNAIGAIKWRQCGKLLGILSKNNLKIIDQKAKEIALLETKNKIEDFLWVPENDSQIAYTTSDETGIWDFKRNIKRIFANRKRKLSQFSNSIVLLYHLQNGFSKLIHIAPHLLDMKFSKDEYVLLIKAYLAREEGLKLYLDKNKALRPAFDSASSVFKEILQTYWKVER